MATDDRKRRMLVAFACGLAFALSQGIAKQIVFGAILLSALLAVVMAGWRLWHANDSLRRTIKGLETGSFNSGQADFLFPRISNRDLVIKWVGALLVSAGLAAFNSSLKILSGILMAIILGLVVDGILFLRVRATTKLLKSYAAVLSQVAGNASPRVS